MEGESFPSGCAGFFCGDVGIEEFVLILWGGGVFFWLSWRGDISE